MFPATLPYTATSRARISDCSWPVRPTVRRWPSSDTGPSTLPSICKSSAPEICPFTWTLAPRHAMLLALGALDAAEKFDALLGFVGTLLKEELDDAGYPWLGAGE